jgi:hypothetical protein
MNIKPHNYSKVNFKKNSDDNMSGMMIGVIIFFIIIIGVIIYFVIKNTKDNGGSAAQALIGKKIGEFCTSNAMCASNKCNKYNICVL